MLRKAMASVMLVALLPLALGGCATHTQTGAAVGGATGVALGAGIGGAVGGAEGALIGGVLGAILGTATGAAVGKHFDDRQQRTRTQASQAHNYTPTQGPLLTISGLTVAPKRVTPGDTVRITVTYDVLAPNPDRQVPISETWVFKHNNKELTTITRPEEIKDQGGHASTFTFAMAQDALPGAYQAIVTVRNGGIAQTAMTPFQVRN